MGPTAPGGGRPGHRGDFRRGLLRGADREHGGVQEEGGEEGTTHDYPFGKVVGWERDGLQGDPTASERTATRSAPSDRIAPPWYYRGTNPPGATSALSRKPLVLMVGVIGFGPTTSWSQ